ncbi:ABC transporter substrate-binding protein [Neorhizobium sp. DT-125]|uniref:ABC transporter substrate-binding protein n=1 Tax=Neorhizobium sp. DT-125 TaxID=3396163 RepID=UPI003F1B2745
MDKRGMMVEIDMSKRALSALFGATMLLAGAAGAQEPVKGGTLNLVVTADIRSLDASRTDSITETVLNHIYEPLVSFRNDMIIGPVLADSWSVSDDGVKYSFHIRSGAVFHNGDKVLASDVKWFWERRMATAGTEAPWLCIGNFNGTRGLKILSVEAADEDTVVYTIEAPNTQFLTRLADPVCNTWVASPKNVGPDGKWIEGSAIGSGPFKLKEWKKEQYISLERFAGYMPLKQKRDGYTGDRTAYVDEVRFAIIPDKTAAETALFAGQIDVVSTIQASRMEDLKSKGAVIQSAPGLSLSAILLQTTDPLLSDVRIRQAMAHAMDLKQITQVKTAGMTEYNPSGVPQASAFFDASFQDWPAYDPEAAKKLLKEAGYKGQVIKIQANQRYIGMYENAVLAQAMLTAVGMNVEIETLDWGAQLDNFLSGKFQMQAFGYGSRPDPVVIYGMFTGSKKTSANYQWDDPKAQELFLKAVATTDFEQRKAIFKEMHALMKEQVPMIGLYYNPVIEAVSPKVVNYESWALDKPRAWGVWKRQ